MRKKKWNANTCYNIDEPWDMQSVRSPVQTANCPEEEDQAMGSDSEYIQSSFINWCTCSGIPRGTTAQLSPVTIVKYCEYNKNCCHFTTVSCMRWKCYFNFKTNPAITQPGTAGLTVTHWVTSQHTYGLTTTLSSLQDTGRVPSHNSCCLSSLSCVELPRPWPGVVIFRFSNT